jgi:hypothetical protein
MDPYAGRVKLQEALELEDQTERMLAVVAVLTEAVRDLGVKPVVVGGLAVQYWTHEQYTTSDIDLLLPSLPAIDERFEALGLERHGRHCYRLHEFVATGHADVAEQAAALVSLSNVDRERLVRRASQERLTNALDVVERLARRSEAGERLETWELHEIARELRRPTLDQ